MTVKEIIIAYCKEHYPEADGLVNYDLECGCNFVEICLWGGDCSVCKPAKYNDEDMMFYAVERGNK